MTKSKVIGQNIIVENVKCFNLALTVDCGQAFRWRATEDGCFEGVAGGYYLKIRQENDNLIFYNTTKESFDNFWVHYFDLDKDYVKICDKIKEDDTIKTTVDEFYGIRIINQEPWEALCSFVISQQNNIKRIKLIVERLCVQYGRNLGGGHYAFPSPEELKDVSLDDWASLGTGYRAKYLHKLVKSILSGEVDLDAIKKLSFKDAKTELLKIYGVGEKVASCALLFGFEFYESFPIDVWMKRVMAYYPNGLPECFKGYEGIAQQYLFHWARVNNIS